MQGDLDSPNRSLGRKWFENSNLVGIAYFIQKRVIDDMFRIARTGGEDRDMRAGNDSRKISGRDRHPINLIPEEKDST